MKSSSSMGIAILYSPSALEMMFLLIQNFEMRESDVANIIDDLRMQIHPYIG